MKIDCYLSPGCASEEGLRENIGRALTAEGIDGELRIQRVEDDEALGLGVTGSPSVLIDGNELQPQDAIGFS